MRDSGRRESNQDGSGFDPWGKEALFLQRRSESIDAATLADAVGSSGRKAFFTRATPQLSGLGDVMLKPLQATCSACGTTSNLDLVSFVKSQLPLPVWWPFKKYPHLLMCPKCHRRTWAEVRLTLLAQLEESSKCSKDSG